MRMLGQLCFFLVQDDIVDEPYILYPGFSYRGLKRMKVLTTMDVPTQERGTNFRTLHFLLPFICKHLTNKSFPPELVDSVIGSVDQGMTREMAEKHRRELMKDRKVTDPNFDYHSVRYFSNWSRSVGADRFFSGPSANIRLSIRVFDKMPLIKTNIGHLQSNSRRASQLRTYILEVPLDGLGRIRNYTTRAQFFLSITERHNMRALRSAYLPLDIQWCWDTTFSLFHGWRQPQGKII